MIDSLYLHNGETAPIPVDQAEGLGTHGIPYKDVYTSLSIQVIVIMMYIEEYTTEISKVVHKLYQDYIFNNVIEHVKCSDFTLMS